MTFDTIERSESGRRPVEIYTFARDYQAWRYTSADRQVVVDTKIFAPRTLTRGSIVSSSEAARGTLKITGPRDLEVADLFRVSPPSAPVAVTLQTYHEGDGEVATLWTGRISTVSWRGSVAEILCEPIYSSLRRAGLRRMYQRQCPHVLYGSKCRVNRGSVQVDGTADTVTAATISVLAAATKADGWFAGGFVEWDVALGIPERRFITDHVGASLTLNASPPGLVAGQAVRLFPGCAHTTDDCVDKFDNVVNYGGMPYFTQKNPFGGDPVY